MRKMPRYVEYFGGFIQELGKRYDGHPALEAVDLSIVGAWGEGAGAELLTQKTREALVNAYTDYFKKTPLIALLTDEKTNKYANSQAMLAGGLIVSVTWDFGPKNKMAGHICMITIRNQLLNLV